MKNMKSISAPETLAGHEIQDTPKAAGESAAAAGGIAPCIVNGESTENWEVRSSYSGLVSVDASDEWSSALTGCDCKMAVKKVYTQPKSVPDGTGYNASVTHYDSFGAVRQKIEVKATPDGKDVVMPFDPVVMPAGEIRSYLPYPTASSGSGQLRADAASEQKSYYADRFSISEPKAYVRQKFEISERAALTETTQPGMEPSVSGIYSTRIASEADKVLDISYFRSTGEFFVGAFYRGAYPVLLKNTVEDEDGCLKEVYVNGNGAVILSRQVGGEGNADTYYVYDDFGRQVYVVSPEGAAQLERGETYSPDAAVADQFCYMYRYDSKGRNVERKFPGKGWEYCVYDRQGRKILMQDANMRAAGEAEEVHYWTLYDYDRFGRMVSRRIGTSAAAATREEFQSLADKGGSITLHNKTLLAEYHYDSPFEYEPKDIAVSTGRWLLVYGLGPDAKWPAVAPLDSRRIYFAADQSIKREFLIADSLLTPEGRSYAAYYIPVDCASLADSLASNYGECAVSDIQPFGHLIDRVRGHIGTDFSFEEVEGICTVYDKDHRTRGLKTQESIAVLSEGMDTAAGKFVTRLYYYDSRGRVIQIAERNALGGVSRYSMKYDFAGRITVMEETHRRFSYPSDSETKRTSYTYDARGRVLSETTTLNGVTGTVAYEYDELGRMSLKNSSGTNNASGLLVTYGYDIRGRLTSIGSSGLYSQLNRYSPTGNIVGTTVNAPRLQVSGVNWTYNYDDLKRLRRASRSQQARQAVYEMDYDLNGNLTRFLRDKRQQKSIAQYYSYSGNTLRQLRRTATAAADRPGTYSFGYDSNGNMTGNGEKQMGFQYNYLNLTDAIASADGTRVYTWLADGTKVQTRHGAGSAETGKFYLGSLIYDYTVSSLSVSTEFAGGMMFAGDSYGYTLLHLTDHLGSVRVVVNGGAPSVYNEYEPFGLLDKEYSMVPPNFPPALNDRRFNGKEELFPASPSGLLDYGARMYDPMLGRWNGVDPLGHETMAISPYVYCANNPVYYTDPTGMKIRPTIKDQLAWAHAWLMLRTEIMQLERHRDAYMASAGENADEAVVDKFNSRLNSLYKSASDLVNIGGSTEMYGFEHVSGNEGRLKFDPTTHTITIKYGNDALFIHELTHAGQFEDKSFGFSKDGKSAYGIDVNDEVAAYRAQWSFDPASVDGLNPGQKVSTINDITPEWVRGIEDSTGNLYGPEGIKRVGQTDINVNSLGREVRLAYPKVDDKFFEGWEDKPFHEGVDMYYKK